MSILSADCNSLQEKLKGKGRLRGGFNKEIASLCSQ